MRAKYKLIPETEGSSLVRIPSEAKITRGRGLLDLDQPIWAVFELEKLGYKEVPRTASLNDSMLQPVVNPSLLESIDPYFDPDLFVLGTVAELYLRVLSKEVSADSFENSTLPDHRTIFHNHIPTCIW